MRYCAADETPATREDDETMMVVAVMRCRWQRVQDTRSRYKT